MAPQIDQALGIKDKSVARHLKKTITKIVNETFDLSLLFNAQSPDVLDEFKRKLMEEFPQILDEPHWTKSERQRRMTVVCRHARDHLSFQRCLTKSLREDGLMAGVTVDEFRMTKRPNTRTMRKNKQRLISSPSPVDAPPSPSSTTNAEPATPPARQEDIRIRTSNSDLPSNTSSSTKPPAPSSSTPPIAPAKSNPPNQMGPLPESLQTRAEDVAAFLRTCNPDMSYFLPAFLEFGCRSREFLAALASYSDEHQDHVLRRMASNAPPGVVVTEMDLWVLKQGLKKFMVAAGSSPINKRRQ